MTSQPPIRIEGRALRPASNLLGLSELLMSPTEFQTELSDDEANGGNDVLLFHRSTIAAASFVVISAL